MEPVSITGAVAYDPSNNKRHPFISQANALAPRIAASDFFKMTHQHLDLILEYLDQVGFHMLPCWLQDQITGFCKSTEKNDGLRTGEHDRICERESQNFAGKLKYFHRNLVAFFRSFIYRF